MKKVTELRILSAHKRVERFKEELLERDSEKVQALACLGLKAVCHQADGIELPDHESHRMGLELQLKNNPLTIEDRTDLLNRYFELGKKRHDWRDKIAEIQVKARISGAVRSQYSLGDREFPCWEEHSVLTLLESDLELFREEKGIILLNTIDYGVRHGLQGWRYEDDGNNYDWIRCSPIEIVQACDEFNWVKARESKSFTSPSKLNHDGFDSPRSVPMEEDDNLHWEVSIYAGKGTDMMCGEQIEFQFCNKKPYF